MNNLDDLFMQENESPAPQNNQPFDKEAWKQQKRKQREMVYSMIDDTAKDVAINSIAFQNYLDVQSRFERYSVANALLILAQRPYATRIADFETWKEQGIYIRKKESGFYILEPGEEYQRDDGTTGISYNLKKMFDISQTGAQKQESHTYPDERSRIKALMAHALVPIRINNILPEGVDAIYILEEREIHIRKGMNAGNIFRSLSQELAHAEMDKGDGSYSRSKYDFYAYCVSYMLCKQYGVDVQNFQFDEAPEILQGMNSQEVRAELSVIRETATEISSRMNRMLAQEKDQKRQEPER